MPTTTTPFEITEWDQRGVDEPAEGPPLARATLHKRYFGDVRGEAVATMIMSGQESYAAVERITGSIGGRTGSVVITHGATLGSGAEDGVARGVIVPGSGTGELAGITGTTAIAHDGDGPRLTLEYEFA